MEALLHPQIRFVNSDIEDGEYTSLISDAHDIPFEDETFDGIVAQAVLEHVADPYRCVAEMHRVLKPDGYVYAETPFMQQVHGAGYSDFTRFTYRGHRRLFRSFEEIDSGPACGPGMALMWSYRYFLLSFARGKRASSLLDKVARVTGFWLKYCDDYLIDKPGAFAAASSYYFMGKKSDHTFSDQELMRLYQDIQ